LTITYPAGPARGVAISASPRSRFERVYRSARRHSVFVRCLRYGTMAGIATVVVVVVAANYIPPLGSLRLPGELGNLVINGTKITMQQPRLAGFTADSRPYEFTADTAEQDINKPNVLALERLHATMLMEDKSSVKLTADAGLYDMKAEMLTLHDNIVLTSSTGYEGYLTDAVVDMRKGNVVSDRPVRVKLLNGFLNAKRLEVVDNGALLRFGGGVAMTLQPGHSGTKADTP
jgi:lipopolysaccharide export system protein LptC